MGRVAPLLGPVQGMAGPSVLLLMVRMFGARDGLVVLVPGAGVRSLMAVERVVFVGRAPSVMTRFACVLMSVLVHLVASEENTYTVHA
jgi:hypothetical protein